MLEKAWICQHKLETTLSWADFAQYVIQHFAQYFPKYFATYFATYFAQKQGTADA